MSIFSQFDEQLSKWDGIFNKSKEEDHSHINLMQSHDEWNDFIYFLVQPQTKRFDTLYDPSKPERSKMYDEIFRLETSLEEVMMKIEETQINKWTEKQNILKLTGSKSRKRDNEFKRKKCDTKCKEMIKKFKKNYERYKAWLHDYKGEKDKLMSKLATYHAKEK